MNERLEAIVSGKVQLVMFRDFTQRKASGLRLAGYAKNLPDGTVEVIAEGPRSKLEALVAKLHDGPLLARVDAVETSWKPATSDFQKFVIAYD